MIYMGNTKGYGNIALELISPESFGIMGPRKSGVLEERQKKFVNITTAIPKSIST